MNATSRAILAGVLASDQELTEFERATLRHLVETDQRSAVREPPTAQAVTAPPVAPITPASAETSRPEWLRLPAPGKRCPYSGLSRSTLNGLALPGPSNDHRPPVKSVVLRKRGALRGIRLISYDSLMSYLAGQ